MVGQLRNSVSVKPSILFKVEFYLKVESCLIMEEISIPKCRKSIFRDLLRTLHIFFFKGNSCTLNYFFMKMH